jgi:hypothetical protein
VSILNVESVNIRFNISTNLSWAGAY